MNFKTVTDFMITEWSCL